MDPNIGKIEIKKEIGGYNMDDIDLFYETSIETQKSCYNGVTMIEKEMAKLMIYYGCVHFEEIVRLDLQTVFPTNLYQNLGVSTRFRTRLVDWMMEALYQFNCEQETIFLSIQLMDLFSSLYSENNLKESLHLIASTCIYIASKMEDIQPISNLFLTQKILHNQYNM
jgi:hypothetical protein